MIYDAISPKELTMKSLIIVVLCLLSLGLVPEALGQTPTRARTETGKEVLLYPDGTWKYAEEIKTPYLPSGTYIKPVSAQKVFKSKNGICGIWVDESKWKPQKASEDFEFQFEHTSGDAYTGVIVERVSMPLNALKDVVLENIKKADPNPKIITEEKRLVNGREVLCLVIEVAPGQIPLTFYYYLYTGKAGSIQVVAWTGTNLFDEYKQDLTNFLNGLELYK
jgi:hypothetical protein